MFRISLIALFLIIFCQSSSAQTNNSSERLKVFIDCSSTWCDQTYIRTEINIVDFLLDRVAADVHVLVTSTTTGSGGNRYQLIFFGQNSYHRHNDTLSFTTKPVATDVEVRSQLVEYMKLGLAPLIAHTSMADKMIITMKTEALPATDTSATRDPWNLWVFRIGANGNMNADQVYTSWYANGYVSASRTTEKSKISFSGNLGRNRSSYSYLDQDGNEFKFVVDNHNFYCSHSYVQSINKHWSWAYFLNYTGSTFSNMKQNVYFSPQIEYSFFPYEEVNNRFLTLSYGPDVRFNQYIDTTLYDKTQELIAGHTAALNISLNQKWGTISSGFGYRNFLQDFSLNNLYANVYCNVRITGGLSFNISSYAGLIHDQVYLPKEGASSEEVLTRRRALASSYSLYLYGGLSYRFGSKMNNVVNPRFDGSGNYYSE